MKKKVEIDDFKKVHIVSDAEISPQGTGYAFVSTSINEADEYIANIYYQSLQAESEVDQWTFGDDKHSHPRFSPDGKKMLFQSTRSGTNQIWLLKLDGGEARQLTTFKHGTANPVWSKDGKQIIFTAFLEVGDAVFNQKEQSKEEKQKEQEKKGKKAIVIDQLQYKAEGEGVVGRQKSHIVAYDVMSERFTQLTAKNEHHAFQDISPDGKKVIFAGNMEEDADYALENHLYMLDVVTKEYTAITTKKGSYGAARFSPDGTKIVMLGHQQEYRGATHSRLYVLDASTFEETLLSAGWDFQIGDVLIGDMRMGGTEAGPLWSEDGSELLFIGTDHGATQLYRVDMNGKLEVLYTGDNHVFDFSYQEGEYVVGISTPTSPGEYFHLKAADDMEQLSHMNEVFLAETLIEEPEAFSFEAEDGVTVHGWLLRPFGFEVDAKYPTILEIHGGPHMMYGQAFFHEMQLLAAQGYVVVYMNPRGSYGYGQKFVDGCREDYGGQDYRDLMQGMDCVLERFDFIDADKLGVTGGSYGGFMTNWIVGHTNRFKAAVTQRSISNWLSFYGVSDIGFFFNQWEHELYLLDDPEKLWEISPLKYAKNVETPLLIVHGEEDQRCPIEQGEQFYVALKHQKKEVEFIRFPGAGHELSRSGDPTMRVERLHHICRWFEKYLV